MTSAPFAESARGRLLVVDDEVELMAALRELLAGEGYTVEGYADPAAALEQLRGGDWDVLLTDLMMPGMDGIALLRAAQEIDPQLIGIIMTGQGTVQSAVEAMKTGAFDYVLKPFKLNALQPVVERALRVRRLRRENMQLRDALAVHELCSTMAATLDRRAIVERVADIASARTGADETSVMLLAPEEDALEIVAVRGAGRDSLLGERVRVGTGIAGRAAELREQLLLEGEALDEHLARVAPRPAIRAALSLPLLAGRQLVGTLNLNITRARGGFTPGQVEALKALASAAASALEAARLYERVREEEERYRRVLENVDEIVYMVGLSPEDAAHARTEFVSRRVQSTIGYAAEEFLADPGLWRRLLHPDDAPAVEAHTRQLLAAGQGGTRLYRMRRKESGEYRWFEDRVSLRFDESGRAVGMFGVARDVTERKQAEARIEYLAHHDALTGLPNRTLFVERLDQAMLDAERRGRQVGVLFLDLDRFKNINDSLGHEVGDQFLRAVTERFAGAVRGGDTVARLGGDEFAVALVDLPRGDDTARVAQKLLDVFARPFDIAGRELFVTASAGITLFPQDGHDVQTLLRNADTAMYRAKDAGRNTYRFYAAEMGARAQERHAIEHDLRGALERGELVPEYQPLVDLASGGITGCEALARWRHPRRGLIAPLAFIPVAEESDLIFSLSEWVLRAVCVQSARWRAAGLPRLRVAVNLSARQFAQSNLAAFVARTLDETGLDGNCLGIEITESVLMRDPEAASTALREFEGMGVRIALDDFGTGYSSLSYLKRFPFDTLKIDRSFVRDITTNADDAAIARAIIHLAHSLGIEAVAEGVETAEQLDFLSAHACDTAQGYYFSRPLPAEEFERLLRAGRSPRAS